MPLGCLLPACPWAHQPRSSPNHSRITPISCPLMLPSLWVVAQGRRPKLSHHVSLKVSYQQPFWYRLPQVEGFLTANCWGPWSKERDRYRAKVKQTFISHQASRINLSGQGGLLRKGDNDPGKAAPNVAALDEAAPQTGPFHGQGLLRRGRSPGEAAPD